MQYHNAEKMGYGCAGIDDEPLSIVTEKPVQDIRGEIVWLLCGEGKPRRYGICARFIVKNIERRPGGETIVSGEGTLLKREIPLNNEPWFKAFLDDYQNFSLGFREIKEREYIEQLEKLLVAESSGRYQAKRGSGALRVKGGTMAPRLGDEETRFLSLLPRDGTATGNISLRNQLGWNEEKYLRIRDVLRAQDLISLGKGRGGSVRLVGGDKRALLALVPKDGSTISNRKLIEELGWEEDHYWRIRERLIEEDILEAGRGGGGGTIRRVSPGQESLAEPEEPAESGQSPRAEARAFLSHMPEDGSTISNAKLTEQLGWDEERYQAVKARLLEKGVIAVSSGRGGTVYRVLEEVAEPEHSPRADTKAFLSQMPEDGSTISNARLMEQLGWDEERYQAVKARLLEKGVIAVSSGRGGTVYRVVEEAAEPEQSPRADAKAFLSHLPEDGSTISNARLLEQLGWDEERYQAVKARLLEKGAIALSTGRGGTVYRVVEEAAEPEQSPRADAKAFLSHLPEDGSTISNVRLLEQLGWDEDRYQAVKARLLEKGAIALSTGRGGTVYLVLDKPSAPRQNTRVEQQTTPQPSPTNAFRPTARAARDESNPARGDSGSVGGLAQDGPLEVFIAYERKDEQFRETLEQSLKILARSGYIQKYWHDRKIVAGDDWQEEIDKNLSRAHIILLLISRDFLASEYCHSVELEKAMSRHKAGKARVIPIILRWCRWQEDQFAGLQVLPKDGKPVEDWSSKDAAFLDIEEGILRAIKHLRTA
jgi:hypothetical protein